MQTREQIIAALRGAGASEDTISKAMAELNPQLSEDVLSKSVDELRAAFDREHADETDALAKSMDEAADLVEAVTRGADHVIEEVRNQNDALCKGLVATVEVLRDLKAEISGLKAEMFGFKAGQAGQEARINKALDLPEAPRGQSGAVVVPTPSEGSAPDQIDVQDILHKALNEMENADEQRKRELATAVSRIESGFNPAQIAKSFRIGA